MPPSYDISRLKVLVVEDNVHFRMLVSAILEALGVRQVEEVNDGIEALEVLAEHRPDLVMLDWKMDSMNGLECVRKIRALEGPNRFCSIIMVTGYTEESLRKEARDAGVNDFLGKPISPQSLLSHITATMETPKPFYQTDDYFGPDRRRANPPKHEGPERRVVQIPPVTRETG